MFSTKVKPDISFALTLSLFPIAPENTSLSNTLFVVLSIYLASKPELCKLNVVNKAVTVWEYVFDFMFYWEQ